MKNLKSVDTCATCIHCFVKSEYDDFNEYYCHYDKSKRPKCGSVGMGETWDYDNDNAWRRLASNWNNWKSNHEVSELKVCVLHERL